jgi:hypothetical protein
MNAHVCDQEGCSIILDYGPTCGGFFHELRSILHGKKLQEIEFNQYILRDELQRVFILKVFCHQNMQFASKKSLKIYPSWHA